jgi:outer membrane protein TolC
VTDARAGLTEALAGQVRAEYDYRIALVNLQRALGTLSPPEIAGE